MIIKNDKIKKLLQDKGEQLKIGREFEAQKQEIEQKQRKIGFKLNKIKEKLEPFVEELSKDISEFEEITQLSLNDKGEIEVVVTNMIEEFKTAYLKEKNKKDDSGATKKTE